MAEIDDRGSNFYSRNGVMTLAGAGTPTSTAPVTGVNNGNIQSAPLVVSSRQAAVTGDTSVSHLGKTPFAKAAVWQWPVHGNVTETFGQKSEGITNEGIVIAADEGTPIRAARAGEVAYVGTDEKNYGNIVILRHEGGDMTSYSHARNIVATKGERVQAGAILGYVGQTGHATQPQLHFALREGRMAVDPMTKLPHQMAAN